MQAIYFIKVFKQNLYAIKSGLLKIVLACSFLIIFTDAIQAGDLSWLNINEKFEIRLFADNLGKARHMKVTENNDIIITSLRKGEVLLLFKDEDGNGKSDGRIKLLEGLDLPHGLEIDNEYLYVAYHSGVVRIKFDAKKRITIGDMEHVITGIPTGGHVTRTIKKSPKDGWFYVSIGSSCNICIEKHEWRSTIIRFKKGMSDVEVFAKGLRNSVGIDFHPLSGILYGVNNGRDWLGDDLPKEELNKIEFGKHYGWPFMHNDDIIDPDLGDSKYAKYIKSNGIIFEKPVHLMQAHTAPLGLKFLTKIYYHGLKDHSLIAQHGSWNRSSKVGYKVIALVWDGGKVIKQYDFITGFWNPKTDRLRGRPVDIIEDNDGRLYISDDYKGKVYMIEPASK